MMTVIYMDQPPLMVRASLERALRDYDREIIIYRLRAKRAGVVRKWIASQLAAPDFGVHDLEPWGPQDRMSRLTCAIDGAILRFGGEV
jgi:hypothetical protein